MWVRSGNVGLKWQCGLEVVMWDGSGNVGWKW